MLMVSPFLWGKVGSSTDALIWIFAPFWSAAVLVIVIAVAGRIVSRAKRPSQTIRSSTLVNAALLGPAVVVTCLLVVGIARYSFRNGGMKFAEQASDPRLLRQFYQRDVRGSSNSGVELFLADNRATPGDVLDALSRSGFAYVRSHVALNSNTSPSTLVRLAADSNLTVRSFARRRGLQHSLRR
jgi:hypothetical protein